MNSAPTRSSLSADRPFPGLRPYRTEDQDFFFGREDQIFALYRLFDHSRFVAVVGSSGSGKSSLVRAGLLPLLARESVEPSGRTWKMVQMHPGDAPIGSLASAMVRELIAGDEPSIAAARRQRIGFALRRSSFGMSDALRELSLGDASIVLVVDQFEELFRYAARRQGAEGAEEAQRQEEATQFVQVLLAASRDRSLNVYVLLTMRSDFIGDCANFRGLPEAVSASQFLVPSLTRDQREQAIRGPLGKAGAAIEPALVERLLNDGGDDNDQLPVLQHCLSRLWEEAGRQGKGAATDDADTAAAGGRRITVNDYLAIGGMAHALSQHADQIFEEVSDKALAVEQAFRALAEIDGQGRIVRRARLYRDLLAETGVPPEDLAAVVDRFRDDDCSFLTPPKSETPDLGEQTRIDVGHEALLRGWERVSGDPRTGAAYTGWLRAEVADAREYRGLLAMAEAKDKIGPDTVEDRWKRWTSRPRSAAWAERYGGHIEDVEQLFKRSLAALEAEKARKEAEQAAEQRRIELEAQAARAREEVERARLALEAQAARAGEQNALRYARLARRTTFGVSALLCLTLALGVFSYVQWRTAVREKDNVEKSLKIGGDLITGVLSQVQQSLNTGSVSVNVAKDLLSTAQKYLGELETVAQTPAIQALRVNLLIGFADFYTALQDDNNALKFSQQAQTIAMLLVADDASDSEYQSLLYSADFRIGDAESDLSKFGASMQAYNGALTIAQALAAKEPANYVWMQDVAFVLNKIGDIYKIKGPTDQALKEYQAALAIDQKLAHDHPDDASLQRDVATALTRVADFQQANGDPTDALVNYQSALTIRKALADKAPDDASIQSNLSVAYNRVADSFVAQQKYDAAAPLYDAALTIRKNLAKSDPTNSTWQSYLAFEYGYIGDMLMKEQEFAAAADDYRQALQIRTNLVTQDPSNFTWLKNLADGDTALANALLAQGDQSNALAEHQAALALRIKVGAQFPGSATRQRELINEYIAIGDMLAKQGDATGAAAEFQDALNVVAAFVAKHPDSKSLDEARQTAEQRIQALQAKNP
jgi:tetratricopeptide (TPR) repeat protein